MGQRKASSSKLSTPMIGKLGVSDSTICSREQTGGNQLRRKKVCLGSRKMEIGEAFKGYTLIHIVYTGIKSGILDLFAQRDNEHATAVEVATQLDLDLCYVQIWFDACKAFGIAVSDSGSYRIASRYVAAIVDRNSPSYQGGLVEIFVDHLYTDMKTQAELMRSGDRYLFSEHQTEFIDLISKRGKLRARLFKDKFVETRPDVVEAFESNAVVCDIGCGTGTFLEAMNSFFPNPSYIGIDQDEYSIGLCRSRLTNQGMKFFDRNIGDDPTLPEVDIFVMVLCLHEVEASSRLDFLRSCHDALSSGGRMFIMEFPYPSTENEFQDPQFTMGIMDQFFEMTWGTQHMTLEEHRTILTKAGFSGIEINMLEDVPYMVVEAHKGE